MISLTAEYVAPLNPIPELAILHSHPDRHLLGKGIRRMGQKLKSIFDVLQDVCTVPQLQDFIRKIKQDTDSKIHVTGIKDEVIHNLRVAAESGDIDYDKLAEFARDHEESGNQHILFYRPINAKARATLNDGTTIAKSLIGSGLTDGSLPSWVTKPNVYLWSDFRVTKGGGPWTAKLYGLRTKRVSTGNWRKSDIEEDTDYLIYRVEEERIVFVVHWNGSELELRISRAGNGTTKEKSGARQNVKELERRISTLWELLKPAGLLSTVREWNLAPIAQHMLVEYMANEEANQKLTKMQDAEHLRFYFSSVKFLDPEMGVAHFKPRNEKESISSSPKRAAAVTAYAADKDSSCDQTAIFWRASDAEDDALGKEDLRTVVGGGKDGERNNIITIAPRVTSRTIQYIVHWLREYDN